MFSLFGNYVICRAQRHGMNGKKRVLMLKNQNNSSPSTSTTTLRFTFGGYRLLQQSIKVENIWLNIALLIPSSSCYITSCQLLLGIKSRNTNEQKMDLQRFTCYSLSLFTNGFLEKWFDNWYRTIMMVKQHFERHQTSFQNHHPRPF